MNDNQRTKQLNSENIFYYNEITLSITIFNKKYTLLVNILEILYDWKITVLVGGPTVTNSYNQILNLIYGYSVTGKLT